MEGRVRSRHAQHVLPCGRVAKPILRGRRGVAVACAGNHEGTFGLRVLHGKLQGATGSHGALRDIDDLRAMIGGIPYAISQHVRAGTALRMAGGIIDGVIHAHRQDCGLGGNAHQRRAFYFSGGDDARHNRAMPVIISAAILNVVSRQIDSRQHCVASQMRVVGVHAGIDYGHNDAFAIR